jgi:hypothetical protein
MRGCKRRPELLTSRKAAQSLEHIRGLAGSALCLLQHVEYETQLAQETRITHTGRRRVLKREIPKQRGIMHDLYKRVRVRVGDVVLQTRILCFVVKADVGLARSTLVGGERKDNDVPKIEIVYAKPAILDVQIPVHLGGLGLVAVQLIVHRVSRLLSRNLGSRF